MMHILVESGINVSWEEDLISFLFCGLLGTFLFVCFGCFGWIVCFLSAFKNIQNHWKVRVTVCVCKFEGLVDGIMI